VIYEHNNGTRRRVKLYQAGLGVRKIPIANLSPELSEEKNKIFLKCMWIDDGCKYDVWSNSQIAKSSTVYEYH
jgi:hypothetical protein